METVEVWKDIEGYEELYQISNLGNIRSKDRLIVNGICSFVKKGRVLNGSDNGRGYKKIKLKKDGKSTSEYIHRLVAKGFIENYEHKPFVNHIDNNPNNNRADNLEWCTHQENMEWMHIQGRAERTKEWLDKLHETQGKSYKKVIGTNLATGEEIVFEKLNAVKDAGFQPSCVCHCCNGTRNVKQHKGYSWRYT